MADIIHWPGPSEKSIKSINTSSMSSWVHSTWDNWFYAHHENVGILDYRHGIQKLISSILRLKTTNFFSPQFYYYISLWNSTICFLVCAISTGLWPSRLCAKSANFHFQSLLSLGTVRWEGPYLFLLKTYYWRTNLENIEHFLWVMSELWVFEYERKKLRKFKVASSDGHKIEEN